MQNGHTLEKDAATSRVAVDQLANSNPLRLNLSIACIKNTGSVNEVRILPISPGKLLHALILT